MSFDTGSSFWYLLVKQCRVILRHALFAAFPTYDASASGIKQGLAVLPYLSFSHVQPASGSDVGAGKAFRGHLLMDGAQRGQAHPLLSL